jgi:BNR/Asp-box repeat
MISGDLRAGLVARPGQGPTRLPRLFAVTEGSSLVRSDNGGATWVTEPLSEVQAVAADADPARLYARAGGRVFRGAAAGGPWVVASPPSYVTTLLADPHEPGRLFAGIFADDDTRLGLWRSTDGGTSWGLRSRGLPSACVHAASTDWCPSLLALASDPHDPDLVLLSYESFNRDDFGFRRAIYRSTDGGRRWTAASQSPPGFLLALAADPERAGTFLVGSGASLYRSVDGGEHWELFGTGLPEGSIVHQLLRDSRSGAWYAATDTFGVFRSTDGGRTWTAIDAGLPDRNLPLVVLDPGVRDRLFAALRALGIWTWRRPGPG